MIIKATEQTTRIITLQMDENIASVLLAIARRVGGKPGDTPRGCIDAIADALRLLNVKAAVLNFKSPYETIFIEDESLMNERVDYDD